MKNTLIAVITLLTVFSISCNQLSEDEKKFDGIMTDVIKVHDEVMPRMGEINSLIKELEPKIDSTELGATHAKAQQELKNSYDFMMEWMSDFGTKFPYEEKNAKLSPEALIKKLKILEEEHTEVKEMRDQVLSSIDNAKKLLTN